MAPRKRKAKKKAAKKPRRIAKVAAKKVKRAGAKRSGAKRTRAKRSVVRAAGDKTRGNKPARRAKASAKGASKAKPKSSARRATRVQRHLLTSVRRPKAPAPRGSTRARMLSRRDQAKRPARAVRAPAQSAATIRDFAPEDAAAVNAVALAAFEQYRGEYQDWPAFARFVGAMADLAQGGELIVALKDGQIAGAVAYFGPAAAKPALFDAGWPVIRMLAVDPASRGAGIGQRLTEECIARARRDGADVIALHTSPIMQVALEMYLRLGFVLLRESEPVFGVPYRIYLKRL